MPDNAHDAEVVVPRVAAEQLDGDDGGVLQEVVVDHAVADDDGVVVGAGGEERVPLVEGHAADGGRVIAEHLGMERERSN